MAIDIETLCRSLSECELNSKFVEKLNAKLKLKENQTKHTYIYILKCIYGVDTRTRHTISQKWG